MNTESVMHAFKKILVPVDLADFSSKIVPYVEGMVEKFDAETYLLYVQRPFEEYVPGHVPHLSAVTESEAQAVEQARNQLKELAVTFFKDCKVTKAQVIVGDAGDEILRFIQSEHIDLTILGTHGRKGIGRLLFGTVAQKVLQTSAVPTLAINPYRVVKPGRFFDFTLEGDASLEEELAQYRP